MRVETHPVYAKQWAGLTEDANYLFDLTMGHGFADATKHNQSPWLERWIVLKGKPGQNTRMLFSALVYKVNQEKTKKK